MSGSTLKQFRHSPAVYEQYSEKTPGLSRIKLAEIYTWHKGMADFYKRTARIAVGTAALLLVVSLTVLSGVGFRTITHSTANRNAFYSSVDEMVLRDSTVEEVKMLDYSSYYVYVDDSAWYGLTEPEKSDYCLTLSSALDERCHSYHIMKKNETARVYFYDPEGTLLAQPSGDGLESVILQ